jgi:futalosine hydrolase
MFYPGNINHPLFKISAKVKACSRNIKPDAGHSWLLACSIKQVENKSENLWLVYPGNPNFAPMNILLVSATTFEIEPTLQMIEKKDLFCNAAVEVLITGIGSVNTTYMLTSAVLTKRPHLVLQAGLAGSFNYEEIPAGKAVLVKYDAFGDLGMEEKGKFTTVFDAGFAGKNHFPFTDGWLINPHPLLNNSHLPVVKSVTINKVSDNMIQQQQLVNTFAAQTETMEGAALHYVCLQQDIPFIQLRSISNEVGERDKSKWKIKESVENLNIELVRFLSDY